MRISKTDTRRSHFSLSLPLVFYALCLVPAQRQASERRRLRSHEMIHTRLLKRNEYKRSSDQVVSLFHSLTDALQRLLTYCLPLPFLSPRKKKIFIVHCKALHCVYENDDDYMHTRLASCKCSLAPERCLLSDFIYERDLYLEFIPQCAVSANMDFIHDLMHSLIG